MKKQYLCASAATLLFIAAQALTVQANFHGDWSALFCTGALQPSAPIYREEHTYLFPKSQGYDGQLSHLIAHDPFLQHGTAAYLDAPRQRYPRILIPLLAWALAFGNPSRIDSAYRLVIWLCVFLGGYWVAQLAVRKNLQPWYGLTFLLVPSTLIAFDRLTLDVALAALTAGYMVHARTWLTPQLWLILAAAALTRETGVLFSLACAFAFRSALPLTALVPFAGWYAFAAFYTAPAALPLPVPFVGIADALMHPANYSHLPFAAALHIADILAISGVCAAAVLALRRFPREPLAYAAALFGLLAFLMDFSHYWGHVYHFGRVYSPLLMLTAAVTPVPTLLTLPRIAMQLAPQALGVAKLIASRPS